MKYLSLYFFLLFSIQCVVAQEVNVSGQDSTDVVEVEEKPSPKKKLKVPKQSFTGLIVDKETQRPLLSVDVRFLNTARRYQVATDSRGYFQIQNIPVGVYDVFVRYMGYKTQTIKAVRLQSGETPFLWIELEQQIEKPDYIEVREFVRSAPSSAMSYGSVESLEPKQNNHWAGSFTDITDGLSFVPGVVFTDDMSNQYSVNGAPAWMNSVRMDGIAIAQLHGQTGITDNRYNTLVNNYSFTDSDIYMGAAGAAANQTGAASLADLKLKPGNFREHQGAVEVGMTGASLEANGPLHALRSLSRASYRAAVSYNDYNVIDGLRDSSFANLPARTKANLQMTIPTKKHGTVRLFGAFSHVKSNYASNPDSLSYLPYLNGSQEGNQMAFGLVHFISLQRGKMNLTTRLGYSSDQVKSSFQDLPFYDFSDNYSSNNKQSLFDFNADMVYKFNDKSMLNVGVETQFNQSDFDDKKIVDPVSKVSINRYAMPNNNAIEYIAYTSYQLKYSNNLKANIGGTFRYYDHTRKLALLPSLGLSYDFSPKTGLAFQYARTAQLPQNTLLYATSYNEDTKEEIVPNSKLDYILSDQLDASFQFNVGRSFYGKISGFMHLYKDVPIANDTTSFYSYFNHGREINVNADGLELVSEGEAKAMGVRLVLEKSLSKNFYVLTNASYVRSMYINKKGYKLYSPWNGNFAFQALIGTTLPITKRVVFDCNLRYNRTEGTHYRVIDMEKSNAVGYTVYTDLINYGLDADTNQRLDLHASVLWNLKSWSQEISIDVRNLADQYNIQGQYYDPNEQKAKYFYQHGRMATVSYRVCF